VVTLALALGARRMAAAHALTRRLNAVETLGSVSVLVSDKTGTLTQGRMAVQQAVTADGAHHAIDGAGYDPTGRVRSTGPGDMLAELARAAVLCNDAQLHPPQREREAWTVAGEQIEGALLAFAARSGQDIDTVRAAAPRVAEEPFDQRTRMMTTEHATDSGRWVVCKGAPEVVLGDGVASGSDEQLRVLRTATTDLAGAGLRTLAIAAGPPGQLAPLGVVGIGDPVRPAAAPVLGKLAAAGIRTVIVTGDHPDTARHVAEQIHLWRPGDTVVTCEDDGWRDADPATVRVFARARPEHKLAIVEMLRAGGAVVAVTGDGVNDAPALRRAHIGVAVGSGTAVAHQAAQLVLADDELGTLAAAVAEGRRVYDNIRRFLRYALSGGVAELLTMLLGPAVGLPIPILPGQILWINLLTHGLPGVAMGAEPGSPEAMRRDPRPPDESVLGAGLGRAVLLTGALIGACTLGTGVVAAQLSAAWQSIAFLVLGFAQLGVALAVRAPRRGGAGNVWLGVAVALSAALMLAGVAVPALRDLLGTDPLPLWQVFVALAVAAVPGAVLVAQRTIAGRRPRPGVR
jgi:Ca2+-transporting ATPase